jgi:hypothetical protein
MANGFSFLEKLYFTTMKEISINTPALLFPAITLLMLAYTNRFLALSARVRKLHEEYLTGVKEKHIIGQIRNLRGRINLIRYMQSLGIVSFLLCVVCIYVIFRGWLSVANYIFAASLLFLLSSILLSLIEINKSTKALELELSDIEGLSKTNILKDIFERGSD